MRGFDAPATSPAMRTSVLRSANQGITEKPTLSEAPGEGHWHFCQFSMLSCRSTLPFVGVTISTCVDPTEVRRSYGDQFG
jgi:hypothetical protein